MKNLDIEKNVIDTLELARSKYPGTSNSLDNLCKKFNIDLSKRTRHNALLDCELLRKVYINLIGEKEPTLIFQDDNNSQNSDLDENQNTIKDYSKMIVQPSPQEVTDHRKFLKNELKKNYF